MKVCIMGGSFDPLHKGHLEIIKRLSNMFDKVLVVPTTIRYYKKNLQMFSFNERFENVKNHTSSFKNVEVSDVERSVDENWRFINTLDALIEDGNEYFIAMGSDSFQKFETWCDYEKILEKAKLIVFKRPNYETNFPNIEHTYIDDIDIDISSTTIRNKIKNYIEEFDFDVFIDDLSFTKGFEDELDYNY